ncbi:hypothetical protein [Streptomyces acidiscabies]
MAAGSLIGPGAGRATAEAEPDAWRALGGGATNSDVYAARAWAWPR